MAKQGSQGPWLYSETNGNVVGVKNANSSESFFFLQPTEGANPFAISTTCRFNLPWVKTSAGNAVDASHNADAVKQGAGTVTETDGYLTTKAGTFGSGGTGRYYYVDANQANFELDGYTAIYHFRMKKATPASTEKIMTVQNNSSTQNGLMIEAYNTGAFRPYFRIGGTQNNLTSVTGALDNTEHTVDIVLDRELRKGYVYLDTYLVGTTTLTGTGTTHSGTNLNIGSAQNAAVYDALYAQLQLYVIPKDLKDIPIQYIVDKLYAGRLAFLTLSDLGV